MKQRRHHRVRLVQVMFLMLAVCLWVGCNSQKLSEEERTEIMRVFHTGVDMKADPYVQVETMRFLTILADPGLNHFAEPGIQDKSPAVRVAALRVLLVTDHPQLRQHTIAMFNKADDPEKLAIVNSVMELGDPTLQRILLDRAVRSTLPKLRLIAFKNGLISRVDEALASKNTDALRQILLPELGAFLDHEDEQIAALALHKVVKAGDADRATALITQLSNGREPVEMRLRAARILTASELSAEELPTLLPEFHRLIETFDAPMDSRRGSDQRRLDAGLVRAAILGSTALDDPTYIERAQGFIDGADTDETLEVLTALARNNSDAAAVSMRVAMRHSQARVRRHAVLLYSKRSDARADALIGAMRHDDFETQKLLAEILSTPRFVDDWSKNLALQLQNTTFADETLARLRNVLSTPEELAALRPAREMLEKIATDNTYKVGVDAPEDVDKKPRRAALAAYLLVQIADAQTSHKIVEEHLDHETRYAYLEHLIKQDPAAHVDSFRRHFKDDLFALRLASSTGLWLALAGGPKSRIASP